MSNFTQFRSNEEELSSPSSDEKMDTGSESFRSQDTPNSLQSPDFEDNPEDNVLRLQNPGELSTPEVFKNISDSAKDHRSVYSDTTELNESEVLRLSKPEERNNVLLKKNSNLNIDSSKDVRPKNFRINPPRLSSTLTITTDHPLVGLGSPEDYPDLIPKKSIKIEDEKDLSLSSIEDERPSETNGFYSPQRNTSKNNLYITENFVTLDSHIVSNTLDLPPDVARVMVERRKVVPKFDRELTPHKVIARKLDANQVDCGLKTVNHSTPKCSFTEPVNAGESFHSAVADWRDGPPLRTAPNFDLPIEMSSSVGMHNDLESPDVISSSTQEDKSTYEALLDPYTGSVALRHTSQRVNTQHVPQRRKIQALPDDSLDSISASSIESEEEPADPDQLPERFHSALEDEEALSDDDSTKRSKSTNTISYTSEPIPEYSLDEELSNERRWLSVQTHPCDVKVIEPYKRVLSHGGYCSGGQGAALIVFSACYLPDNARHDYTYVMHNLFLYVMWSLERLVTEEYVVVYLHGGAARRRLPRVHWLHDCYKLVDHRLRKSLKQLYLVHPSVWLKSFVYITKPFISTKFFKKLVFVNNLDELMEMVPVDSNAIPEIVKQYDANRKR